MTKKNDGFTLLELLTVILIVGILAVASTGSFTQLISGSVSSVASESAMVGFYSAKSEALKRRTNVTICALKSNSQDTCGTNQADWKNGYLIFVDNQGGEADGIINSGDEILVVNQNHSSVVVTSSNTWFSYDGEGRSQAGTVRFCDTSEAGRSKLLNMSLIGIPKVDDSAAGCS
ncbi:GspH/FimT family pseudopilin [Litoribrevibacter albus]|uniref:Type II secretion system protein H n=1 Tax=Litoribrevibacter albus TaxID=1473156 RepID=A0AA37W4S3_9GAMM|nr:GspH/FimT family protein [Litoribrevibacter albus]GLQ29905.1 hypothetical protein GCM10007876_03830 [Litoribrevibacter albus]